MVWLKDRQNKKLGISDEKVHYINFEDYDYSFIRTGKDLHEYAKSKIKDDGKYYLFFDKIQVILEFE